MSDNLRRTLAIARKALKSDRAYIRARNAEEERQWNHWCHLDHLAIDAAIRAKQKLRRRRSGPGRKQRTWAVGRGDQEAAAGAREEEQRR